MQSNRKGRDGSHHPDRNEQFEFINASAEEFLERGWPVISVDTKKKDRSLQERRERMAKKGRAG